MTAQPKPKKRQAGLVCGDAVAIPLADESVDLIVTSPPYWSHRDYGVDAQIGLEDHWAGFVDALLAVTAECARVLKPRGSMFVNLGDRMAGSGGYNNASVDKVGRGPKQYTKMATRGPGQGPREGQKRALVAHQPAWVDFGEIPHQSRCLLPQRYALGVVDQLGLKVRAPIIWHKNTIPQNPSDRVESRHEDIWHITKTSPCWAHTATIRQWESVWRIPTEPLQVPDGYEKHYAAFPQELPRRCILGWCPEGGVVLDPFGGTGTVAMVARALGRYPVHMDLSADYLRLARWRIYESGHYERKQERVQKEAVKQEKITDLRNEVKRLNALIDKHGLKPLPKP